MSKAKGNCLKIQQSIEKIVATPDTDVAAFSKISCACGIFLKIMKRVLGRIENRVDLSDDSYIYLKELDEIIHKVQDKLYNRLGHEFCMEIITNQKSKPAKITSSMIKIKIKDCGRRFKMKNNRIASIVLAAGYSSRMGIFKPLLKFGQFTAVKTIVNTHKNSGIDDIIVVVGHRGSEVMDELKDSGVKCVLNENYSQGMFSSVLKGVKALDENMAAFFIQPVDIPLIKKWTIELLKNRYMEYDKGIIYPDFLGERGHPPLIDCKYKQAILNSNGDGGLKKILENFEGDSLYVPVFDETTLMDMDTRQDYMKLLRYYFSGAPNRMECYTILDMYNVPENIIKHCSKVAEVSVDILDSLKDYGNKINRAALEAAALLHDIARKEENHARVGEMILKEIGYENVGYIISTHTDIDIDENGEITENEILYLADKLVKEDRVIPIGERMKHSIQAYGHDSEVSGKIRDRFEAAQKIIKKIEKVTGKGFIYG